MHSIDSTSLRFNGQVTKSVFSVLLLSNKNIARIGFKNDKSLKDHLVRLVLPKIDVAVDSRPCGGKRRP